MRKIVIFGASSAIAEHTARKFSQEEVELVLVARSEQKLAAVADDLRTRGAKVAATLVCDLADISKHEVLLQNIEQSLADYDTVLLAHGMLGDQEACQVNYEKAEEQLRVNLLSHISLLTRIANIFEARRRGCIAVIGSVAGDRGRKSNYVYGCSKGALEIFCSGLRNRLHDSGVQVLTIKPGFVATPMTAHLKHGPLFANPEQVAEGIYKAIKSGRNVVYLPWFWRYIMLIIKHIPEALFKKMSI